jgi:hypothetical protein
MMEKTKKVTEAEKKVKEVEEKLKRSEKLLSNNKTKISRLEKEVSPWCVDTDICLDLKEQMLSYYLHTIYVILLFTIYVILPLFTVTFFVKIVCYRNVTQNLKFIVNEVEL